MSEANHFRIEDITEITQGIARPTSIDWQGSQQIFSHKEPDTRLKGNGIVCFGCMALVTDKLWENIGNVALTSPLFMEKGITSCLWMRADRPNPKQLADDGRELKGKIATHIGWLIKLEQNQTLEEIKALEEAPAVVGFWVDSDWINQPDLAILGAIERPILLETQNANLSAYQKLLTTFKALKKRPFIINAPIFHPRDYPELVNLQSIGRMLSDKTGISVGGHYLPIISHMSQLSSENNHFWAKWLGEDAANQKWQISYAQQQVYKIYNSFGIAFKGRKISGYNADIVVLDEQFRAKTVIIGGKIALWENEFTQEFAGSGLKIWH
ncbi:MAG: hypothetical protein ACK5MJ_02605 [Alphaproteobacteria bacterium]